MFSNGNCKPCSYGGITSTLCTSTGWGPASWKVTWQEKTWRFQWTPSWPGVSNGSLWHRQLTAPWAALGKASPAALVRWLLFSIQHKKLIDRWWQVHWRANKMIKGSQHLVFEQNLRQQEFLVSRREGLGSLFNMYKIWCEAVEKTETDSSHCCPVTAWEATGKNSIHRKLHLNLKNVILCQGTQTLEWISQTGGTVFILRIQNPEFRIRPWLYSSNLHCSEHRAGLDDLQGPFQPQLYYDSMII